MTEQPSTLRRLPREVWAFGTVSLLTDTASHMVYPLLPKLLETLGGGAVALGVLEGTGELLATVVKVWSGRASDRSGARGPFVVFGYALAALSRPALALVNAPWQVVLARSLDRIGKGIRTAPRDALMAAVTTDRNRGLAFGVQGAMDNLGAVFGPAVAWSLLAAHVSLRQVFVLAVIPGLMSTAVAWLTVRREKERFRDPEPEPVSEPVTEPGPEAK
ncbi:MAG: MFS transporter, partial [Polyangiales bacterium]